MVSKIYMRSGFDAGYFGSNQQYASVKKIILDEGQERGVSALSFSTGGGLDFWVLLDRAMDIGPIWKNGVQQAWISPAGFKNSNLIDSDAEDGHGFRRGFSGFLMTCGLDNIRAPNQGMPQHGRISFLPARLTSYGEVWDNEEPYLFCEGEVIQWKHQGEALSLIRRIEAPIGGTSFKIYDSVKNIGINNQRHALLYHFNLGYPLVQKGSTVELLNEKIFDELDEPSIENKPQITCNGIGSNEALCVVKTLNEPVLKLSFETENLPFLQVWSDTRPQNYVLALEPCTSMRPKTGEFSREPDLKPNEARKYKIEMTLI